MSHKDTDQTSDEVTGDTTTIGFPTDFLGELDASSVAAAEAEVWGVEGLSNGSALLVVKRGPNAGSRFLLDQPPRRPAAIPTATSSSTTSPSAVGTLNSEWRPTSSRSSTSAASTAPMSTTSRWSRRCWPTATRSRSASTVWCS